MTSESFSHQQTSPDSPQPGTKLGEPDRDCEVRLEAQDARSSSPSPQKEVCRFRNGWFCQQCDRVTEHKKVRDREICLECGFAMGDPSKEKNRLVKNKEKLTAQQRDYRVKNKEKLTAQKRDYYVKNKEKIKSYQREWVRRRRLEKKLEALKMEASHD